jgi:cellulose synthase/poly-beta-1,6-N-acetylglucosamine synthase-like glycosyltransferase
MSCDGRSPSPCANTKGWHKYLDSGLLPLSHDRADFAFWLSLMIAFVTFGLAAYVAILTYGYVYLIGTHIRLASAAVDGEKRALITPALVEGDAPAVCVQVPIHNEPLSVSKSIDSLCSLEWPHDRLEIMVLDDSTDETSSIVDAKIADWRARGISISALRRVQRFEFKAGALQEALSHTDAPYIAIFDADYRPPRLFLREMMNVLVIEPSLAFVQARLDYRNQSTNWLTRAQALELDTLLVFEHAGKNWAGLPTYFNGTCGVWRRAAIEEAGGWSGRSLVEDQDLSFRAFELGWKSRYVVTTSVGGELPATFDALSAQRRRWNRGSAQILRLLPWRLVKQLKWHQAMAFVSLCLFNTTASPVIVLLATVVVLAALSQPQSLPWSLLSLAVALLPIIVTRTVGSALATHLLGRKLSKEYWLDLIYMWILQAALLPAASVSFVVGLLSRSSVFVRTPKTGA